MSQVVLIFIDGIGIGRKDPAINPLVGAPILGNFLPADWSPPPDGGRPVRLPEPVRDVPVPFGGVSRAVDASLGVRGLPQSATGQTTLFTGVNGAEILGHHHYGFPGPRLREVLREHSIMRQMTRLGRSAALLNAYTPIFFELGEEVWKRRMSASSWTNRAAELPFMTFDDMKEGRAVFHDFTLRSAREKGFEGEESDPEDAGAVLARAASAYDFSIYEFFMTDLVGHTGDLARAHELVAELETFLSAALGTFDLGSSHVILTSDHGNMEDMSTRSHTHNPIPAIVWGPDAQRLAGKLSRLEDFTAAIIDEVAGRSPGPGEPERRPAE